MDDGNLVLFVCVATAKSPRGRRETAAHMLMWCSLSLTCTFTSTLNTQLTGNQANCRVEWCVVIFRHDYPAELVRKRIVIRLGERTRQKTRVQSGPGDNGAGWSGDCVFIQMSVFVCLTIALICCPVKVKRCRLITPKNNRATVLMVHDSRHLSSYVFWILYGLHWKRIQDGGNGGRKIQTQITICIIYHKKILTKQWEIKL